MNCKACERLLSPSETECRRCGKKVSKSETTVRIRETGRDDAVIPGVELVTLAEMEKRLITIALTRYGVLEAARRLGIGKTTMYERLKLYGLKGNISGKRTVVADKPAE